MRDGDREAGRGSAETITDPAVRQPRDSNDEGHAANEVATSPNPHNGDKQLTGRGSNSPTAPQAVADDEHSESSVSAHSRSPRRSSGTSRDTRASNRRRPAADAVAAARASSLDPGDELEIRLARCAFWEGSYARRGIDLERHFASAPLTITDLDLLALEFNAQLQQIRTIGEAKSGTGKSAPKPLDRALWLAGVARLVRADRAELVTALQPSDRVRTTVADLNVTAMSIEDLGRREAAVEVATVADIGSHGPTSFIRVKEAHARLKREPELERAFWFLRSEVWFHSPWTAAKRTIGVLRVAATWWTPRLDDADAAALRWLLAEAVSVLTVNLVSVAGLARHGTPQMFAALANERLAEGAVPTHQMSTLSDAVDTFVARAVKAAGGTPNPDLIGAFLPQPPDYAEALIELVTRLAANSAAAIVPRHVDLVMHERLVHRRHVDAAALARVDRGSGRELTSARKLIAAFLRGAGVSLNVVDTALTTDAGQ